MYCSDKYALFGSTLMGSGSSCVSWMGDEQREREREKDRETQRVHRWHERHRERERESGLFMPEENVTQKNTPFSTYLFSP